ncbi:MAG: hypothetical protein HYX69_15405 [Planctomycetia bacterium]|nr:hypothetical protein [Planctomycetia bacterium]
MNHTPRPLACLLVLGVALCAWGMGPARAADDPPPAAAEDAKPPPADPDALRIHLMDGSQITGRLATAEIAVDTSFGKLAIPVASIKSMTPGLGSHPKVEQNIGELIEKLGSPVFGEREAAQKALVEMGPSIRLQLDRAANDADTERKSRVKAILEEFDQIEEDAAEQEASGVPRMIDRDTVETNEFTVVGKVVQQEFEIVSRYGPLNVKLSDIRRIQRDVAEKEDLQKTIAVEGNHIIHRGLKDTGIRVVRGDKITFAADGTIQMTPWGNQAVSTPEGAPNFGWYVQNKISGGTLVGKIGTSGPVFRIGTKLNLTADRSGVLQLAVAMQGDYANQQFPGEYKVRVRVKRK